MTPSHYLEMGTATMPDVRDFVARVPFAILPVGSTEQHGPHLPTNTDTLIAEAIALETARRSCGIVLPAQPLGYAWVWRDNPASLTLAFDTYMRLIRDTVESLSRWGVKAVYIMSGHGANSQVIKQAVREMIHGVTDVKVLFGMYAGLNQMQAEAESKSWHGDIHAEEIETSLMLAIEPHLVHMDRAVADYPPVPADYGQSELSMGHLMRTGVFGDATKATEEKGRRWLDLAAQQSAELWSGFLARHNLTTGVQS
ncbi:MAG: creatininase family protein [Rhizobium sp.]|nr:creatininase family protein [Rhizobium sp.]